MKKFSIYRGRWMKKRVGRARMLTSQRLAWTCSRLGFAARDDWQLQKSLYTLVLGRHLYHVSVLFTFILIKPFKTILSHGSFPSFVLIYGWPWPTCESMNKRDKEWEPKPWRFNPLEIYIQKAQLLVCNLTSHFIWWVIIGWMVTDHTGCHFGAFLSISNTV